MLWKSLVESYDHQTRSLVWANVQGTRYAYSLCSMRPVIQVRIVVILNGGRDGRSTSATNPTYESKVLAASTMWAEGASQEYKMKQRDCEKTEIDDPVPEY